MNYTDLQKRGGVGYTAPICEFVELDINEIICQSFGIEDWNEDDSGLTF